MGFPGSISTPLYGALVPEGITISTFILAALCLHWTLAPEFNDHEISKHHAITIFYVISLVFLGLNVLWGCIIMLLKKGFLGLYAVPIALVCKHK